MIGLAEKTLPELESLAEGLREVISRDSQHPRADLEDVEWELEKRRWRKDSRPRSNTETVTTSQQTDPRIVQAAENSRRRTVDPEVPVAELQINAPQQIRAICP